MFIKELAESGAGSLTAETVWLGVFSFGRVHVHRTPEPGPWAGSAQLPGQP